MRMIGIGDQMYVIYDILHDLKLITLIIIVFFMMTYLQHFFIEQLSPPRWCRDSGLDFGSEDPGSIPRLPSPRVGPLMARG